MEDIKKSKKQIKISGSEIDLRQSPANQKETDSPRKFFSGSNEPALEWQAPSFKYYAKDVSWYWLSFIISLLIIAFAVLQKNFLFAVFIFMAEISVLVLARRKPEIIKFRIDDKGLTIMDKTYFFNDLEKFCLRPDVEDQNFEELIIKKKTYVNPYLKIFVDANISAEVHEILSKKLTEEQYEDSLLEVILKWLRF